LKKKYQELSTHLEQIRSKLEKAKYGVKVKRETLQGIEIVNQQLQEYLKKLNIMYTLGKVLGFIEISRYLSKIVSIVREKEKKPCEQAAIRKINSILKSEATKLKESYQPFTIDQKLNLTVDRKFYLAKEVAAEIIPKVKDVVDLMGAWFKSNETVDAIKDLKARKKGEIRELNVEIEKLTQLEHDVEKKRKQVEFMASNCKFF